MLGFFLLIDCKLSFDPNRNVTVFLVSPSEAKNHSFFFLCSFEYIVVYLYEYKYIYTHT